MAIAALAPVAHSRAASKRAEAGASLQLVGFRLADEEYGFEIMKVREIILVGSITRIPQSSPYVRGVINLRGLVIPIVDLRLRFGMSAQPDGDATRIIVTSCNGQTIGFVVDEVNEVLRVGIEPVPAAQVSQQACW